MDFSKLNIEELIGKAGDLAKKIGGDEALLESFKKDPIKTLEEKLGIDLPNEQIQKVIDAIKAKLTLDQGAGLLNKIGGLFKK